MSNHENMTEAERTAWVAGFERGWDRGRSSAIAHYGCLVPVVFLVLLVCGGLL